MECSLVKRLRYFLEDFELTIGENSEEILEMAATLCERYGKDAEHFVESWMAFAMSSKTDLELNEGNLELFEKEELSKEKMKEDTSTAGLSLNSSEVESKVQVNGGQSDVDPEGEENADSAIHESFKMKWERSVPSQKFVTGFVVEKRSLTWTIEGFPLIRKYGAMINFQRIEFTAGETAGYPSQWTVELGENIEREDDKRWIGIYLRLQSPNPTDPIFQASFAGIQFTIKDKEGKEIKFHDTGPIHIPTKFVESRAWGASKFIDAEDSQFCPEESLVIEMIFQLSTFSQSKTTSSLNTTVEKRPTPTAGTSGTGITKGRKKRKTSQD